MPSGFRRSDLGTLAVSPSLFGRSGAGLAYTGAVRLPASVLRRVLMTVATALWRLERVVSSKRRPLGSSLFPVTGTALPFPCTHASVLVCVCMALRAVRDLVDRVRAAVGDVAAGRALAFTRSAVALPVCRNPRVARGVLVPPSAPRLPGVPVGDPAARGVLGAWLQPYVRRVHAAPMNAGVTTRALAWNVALMVGYEPDRYRPNQDPIGNQVRVSGPAFPTEFPVSDARGCDPAPAPARVNTDLVPEALRQSEVSELRGSGTFGHVRLLYSRTAPRECVRTRRGFSRHFIESRPAVPGEYDSRFRSINGVRRSCRALKSQEEKCPR